ncbi:MAG: nucleotide pyrophosphohydrolase [Verrucomicrobiota bacterium]
MDDSKTTLDSLKGAVARFADERDWWRFHTPKNLAMSVAIEAAELMEEFQWLENGESAEVLEDQEKKQAVEEELADVLIYALQLANVAKIEVGEAVRNKMVKNAEKYPAG